MKRNSKNWMKFIDDSQNLFALNIPGTHDCATKYVWVPFISQCQDMDIHSQLDMGVRALDIRVQSKGKRLALVHGYDKCLNSPQLFKNQMDMADVLYQCYKFLEENESETIIFQFKNDSGKEMKKCFNNLFYTYIRKNPNRWYLQNKIPTLEQVRGKIVLIRRCKMDNNNQEFNDSNTGIDFSHWVEQKTAQPHPLELSTNSVDDAVFVIQDRYKYNPQKKWYNCLKPFLDSSKPFDNKYIINYLSTAGGAKGINYNARYINEKFIGYPLVKGNYYGTVYVDFPTQELVDRIINLNF